MFQLPYYPRLPFELLHEIIDILGGRIHEDDSLQALRSCLMVSRAFRHFSRRHIFGIVHVSPSPPALDPGYMSSEITMRLSNLRQLIDALDGIGPYITTFNITQRYDEASTFDTEDLVAVISQLAASATKLEKIVFGGMVDCDVEWPSLSMEFKVAFHKLISSRPLQDLELRNIAGLPDYILRGVLVEKITLHEMEPDFSEEDSVLLEKVQIGHRPYPVPRSISTDLSCMLYLTDSTQDCLSAIPFNLETLELTVDMDNGLNLVWDILTRTKDFVEDLTLCFYGTPLPSLPHASILTVIPGPDIPFEEIVSFDFGALKHLRRLNVVCEMGEINGSSLIRNVIGDLLQTATSARSLECLHLVVTWKISRLKTKSYFFEVGKRDWKCIKDLLARKVQVFL